MVGRELHERKMEDATLDVPVEFKNYSPTVFMISLCSAALDSKTVCRRPKILFTEKCVCRWLANEMCCTSFAFAVYAEAEAAAEWRPQF